MDGELTDADVRAFGALAWLVEQGNVANETYSEIASLSQLSRSQVQRSMNRLIDRGHVKPSPTNKQRRRGFLLLTSPVFGQKQRSGEVEEAVSAPSGGRRLVSVRTA